MRGRRLLVTAEVLAPDGLAVDEAGTVWVADAGGTSAVWGFGPDGEERGRIPVPATMVTSICFGGAYAHPTSSPPRRRRVVERPTSTATAIVRSCGAVASNFIGSPVWVSVGRGAFGDSWTI